MSASGSRRKDATGDAWRQPEESAVGRGRKKCVPCTAHRALWGNAQEVQILAGSDPYASHAIQQGTSWSRRSRLGVDAVCRVQCTPEIEAQTPSSSIGAGSTGGAPNAVCTHLCFSKCRFILATPCESLGTAVAAQCRLDAPDVRKEFQVDEGLKTRVCQAERRGNSH